MKISTVLSIVLAISGQANAFTASIQHNNYRRCSSSSSVCSAVAAMADSGVPATTSEPSASISEDASIPKNLPSAVGKDYIPLATMLATGQLAEADQVCLVTVLCVMSM